jgi:hypothetical protein
VLLGACPLDVHGLARQDEWRKHNLAVDAAQPVTAVNELFDLNSHQFVLTTRARALRADQDSISPA